MGEGAQSSHTTPGLIVGTVQYMSPEQLEGKEVDARTDIFAFGAVLYELVTGRKAFQGETPASVISSIMSAHPPPISSLEPLAPRALDRFVRKCLEKDRDERWSSMHDVVAVLEWVREAARTEPGQTALVRPVRERVLGTALATLAIVAAAIAAWVLWPEPSRTIAARFDIALPKHLSFDSWLDAPILSPDGRYVALAASDAGVRRLMVRRLADQYVTAVAGTEGVHGNPFWSPDGESVAFFTGSQLKRVAVTGGPVVSVCDCESAYGWGGSWNEEGVLLFAARSGIWSVRDDGTGLRSVIRLADGEYAHHAPAFLPDGRHFLYAALGARQGIYAASLDGGAATLIVEGGSRAQYVADGHVLFTRGEALFAQPFDLRARQLRGAPSTVAEDVLAGVFSASNNSAVAYRPATMRLSRLAWFGRDGARLSVVSDADRYAYISLSPSGRKVAIQRREDNSDLWLLDLTTEVLSKLTTDPARDADPVWSPDERQLVFTSNRLGRNTLFLKDLISGKEEPLLTDPPAPGASVDDWSSDGRLVIFRRGFGEAIYSLAMEGERKPQLIAEMRAHSDQSQLSPDGKWLAFESNETGRWEVYVAAFPGFTDKRSVSTYGGLEPIWRDDGRELFYLDLDGRLMAVPVSTQPEFDAGKAVPLFRTGMRPNLLNQYAAAKDGQKFLLLEPDRSGGEGLAFILDWRAQLQPN
jgi:Tol biopolymer transport system component